MPRHYCLRQTSGVDAYLESFAPLPGESAPLPRALGRVLAQDVTAPFDCPPSPRSTRDGFALRGADTARARPGAPVRLAQTGECRIGDRAKGQLLPGQAWRVYTGSELPLGADAVVMQEDAEEDATTLLLTAPVHAGANVLPVGADLSLGDPLARAGQRLRPQDLALLAQCRTQVLVRRRPVLGVLSTGDEFCREQARGSASPLGAGSGGALARAPGLCPPDGVHASGALLLAGLARKLGARSRNLGVCPDDPDILRERLEAALGHPEAPCDVLVVTGGSSGGRRDFTAQVLAGLPGCLPAGQDQHVSSGRPLSFARIGDVSLWVLPGHMLSLVMVAQVFVAALLLRLMGQPSPLGDPESVDVTPWGRTRARLGQGLPSHAQTPAHYPVTLESGPKGLVARPVPLGTGKNAVLRDMAGWVSVPGSGPGLPRGRVVPVRLFA